MRGVNLRREMAAAAGVDDAGAGAVAAGRRVPEQVGVGRAVLVRAGVGEGVGLAGGVGDGAVGDVAVGLTDSAGGLCGGVFVAAELWLQAPARRPSPTRRHSPRLSLGAIRKSLNVSRLRYNTC